MNNLLLGNAGFCLVDFQQPVLLKEYSFLMVDFPQGAVNKTYFIPFFLYVKSNCSILCITN